MATHRPLYRHETCTSACSPARSLVKVRVSVEVARLQGGEQCVFRAIATAELQSASVDTVPIALPHQPRRLHLRLPSAHCPIAPGPVALAAMLDTCGRGAVAPDEIHWHSNLEGELGAGYAITPDLREGRHEIVVSAPDGLGGSVQERGIIIVGGRPVR